MFAELATPQHGFSGKTHKLAFGLIILILQDCKKNGGGICSYKLQKKQKHAFKIKNISGVLGVH